MPNSTQRAPLTTGDLADLLSMDRSGVASAADAGRLGPVERTPGGHRRFNPATVVAELRARGATVPPKLEEMAAASAAEVEGAPAPRAASRPEHRVRVKGGGR